MVIYGEYLFLENFITGFIIFFFTGKIAGEKTKLWRLLICAVCSGAYSFVLFTGLAGVLSLVCKLSFAVVMTMVAFGAKSLKRVMMNAVLFMVVTFLYGGITIALLIAFSWEGVTAAEGLYMPSATYLTVTCAGTAAALIVYLTVNLIRTKRQEQRSSVETVVSMNGKEWMLKGYIDSGNFLKEPITGRPVAVAPRSVMESMLSQIEDGRVRYTVVPYNAVGVKIGIMDGYRVDYMKISGKTVGKPVLAVCGDDEFPADKNERQILLPGSMLERGIYADLD